MLFWTQEEFAKFIAAVDSFEYNVFFRFLYFSGCRKGEAFALRWKDIDFSKKTARISKSYTIKGEMAKEKYNIKAEDTTKNKKNRTILLPQHLLDLLKKLKETNTDFVFGNDAPLATTTVARKFDEYIQAAEVSSIHIHCLRHSHVALVISNGDSELATLYAVADRIGDTVEMVLKTYGHLFRSRQKEILGKLEQVNIPLNITL